MKMSLGIFFLENTIFLKVSKNFLKLLGIIFLRLFFFFIYNFYLILKNFFYFPDFYEKLILYFIEFFIFLYFP
jgi:hypothetical protein